MTRTSWIKGKTKETDARVRKISSKMKKLRKKKHLVETAYYLGRGWTLSEIGHKYNLTPQTMSNYRKYLRNLSKTRYVIEIQSNFKHIEIDE
jgi:hypothetical protein